MLIGDPYKFAIIIDLVENWSKQGFKQGILFYLIDGKFYPKEIHTTTLNSELYHLFELQKNTKSIEKIEDNAHLFDMDKENLITTLLDTNNEEISYHYKFSNTTMEDAGYYFYFIPKLDKIRIIGAFLTITQKEENYSDIVEMVVSKEYFYEVMEKLKNFYFDNCY